MKRMRRSRQAPAGPFLLRSGAKRVYRMAERLESRMDTEERNAHIRAADKDPDSLDSAVREIHDWLAVQEKKQRKSLSWTTMEFRCRQGGETGPTPEPGESKLDPFRPEIEALLKNGATKNICRKRYGTSATNLHLWLKKRLRNQTGKIEE